MKRIAIFSLVLLLLSCSESSAPLQKGSITIHFSSDPDLILTGAIVYEGGVPAPLSLLSLSFQAENLEEANLKESELRYQWYKEGSVLSGATDRSIVITTPGVGSDRYDLLVYSGESLVGDVTLTVKSS